MRLASSPAAPCGPRFESCEGETPGMAPWLGLRVLRSLVLALCLGVVAFAPNLARAGGKKGKNVRSAIIDLNKKALERYAVQDFDEALDLLATALKKAREAGLEEDKLNARTYVHLGAVYWTGFHNREMALQSFTQAKEIRPDIQLTASLEDPEVRTIFEMATVEPEESGPAPK